MTTPIDPVRCPLCGEANDCQLAAGRSKCWCFDTPVPADVLSRVPPEAQGAACVCKRCAGDAPADRASSPDVTAEELRRRLALRWTKR